MQFDLLKTILNEERQDNWKYTEKRVKGALSKVVLELDGSDSGAMSRLMTRYKRLDRQWKMLEERRGEVNKQVKEVADRIFDAEDALATRVIETVSYTVMLTKATPASEKEATKKTDYESAFSELARLVPELEEKAKEILTKYTELVPPKDTPSALKYTSKLEEGVKGAVSGWLSKAKTFVKELLSWGHAYDAKLDAFRRKYFKNQVALKVKESVVVESKTPPEVAAHNARIKELDLGPFDPVPDDPKLLKKAPAGWYFSTYKSGGVVYRQYLKKLKPGQW